MITCTAHITYVSHHSTYHVRITSQHIRCQYRGKRTRNISLSAFCCCPLYLSLSAFCCCPLYLSLYAFCCCPLYLSLSMIDCMSSSCVFGADAVHARGHSVSALAGSCEVPRFASLSSKLPSFRLGELECVYVSVWRGCAVARKSGAAASTQWRRALHWRSGGDAGMPRGPVPQGVSVHALDQLQ